MVEQPQAVRPDAGAIKITKNARDGLRGQQRMSPQLHRGLLRQHFGAINGFLRFFDSMQSRFLSLVVISGQ
jgi:hypothetical protein